jgi:hypothetical protein
VNQPKDPAGPSIEKGEIMFRRTALAALMGSVVATAPLMIATPAQADSSDCPSNYVCMWEDPNYSGSMYVRQPSSLGSYNIDGWDGDNEISSVYNNSRNCVRMYDNDNYTGTSYFVSWLGMLPNLAQNGYDNEAESFKIINC